MSIPRDDLLGKLKRMLATVPDGAYATPPLSRKTLVAIIEEISELRVALSLAQSGRSEDVQRGLSDQLLSDPEE